MAGPRCAGRNRGTTYDAVDSHRPIASMVKNIACASHGMESGAVNDSIEMVLRNSATTATTRTTGRTAAQNLVAVARALQAQQMPVPAE